MEYQRAIRCYFICTESLADVDLDDPYFKYFVHIHAARCHIMHIDTSTSIFRYAARLQLALSKSTTADIDLGTMDEIKEVEDIYCKTLDDSGKQMSHTDGTGEISPEVAQMLPASVFKGNIDNKEVLFLMTLDLRFLYELFWKLTTSDVSCSSGLPHTGANTHVLGRLGDKGHFYSESQAG